MKWFALFFAVLCSAILAFGLWSIDRRGDYEDACASRGGVAVQSHMGDIVCIDEDALIDIG